MKRLSTIALLAAFTGVCQAQTEFKITVTDPGPQPLSPLFYSASTSAFSLFQGGTTASTGIAEISEFGNPAGLLSIAAGSTGIESYGAAGTGPIGNGAPPANGNTESATFWADPAHPYLSFAAMLGITNDGFIGDSVSSAGLMLFNGMTPQDLNITIYGANAWDAGAAEDAQTAATLAHFGGTPIPINGVVHSYANGLIPGVGDYNALGLAAYNWNSSTVLANISVQTVPEPAPFAALGLGALFLVRRKRASR